MRRARAWLSRAVEPGVSTSGASSTGTARSTPCAGSGRARRPHRILRLVGARAEQDQTLADLRRAERCDARLVVPEDDEWPAFPLHALTLADGRGARRPEGPVGPDHGPGARRWRCGCAGPGRLDELADRSVAIVGSRASTAYGEHVAGELGYQLAERGWTVVSGGAYGIDAAAHRGAWPPTGRRSPCSPAASTGPIRPGNGALLHRIAESGLLVSEWPPGAAPQRHRFLVRNRLIAALTRGTVVVEAAARSGALATANRARRLGKEVMVVPGPVTSAMSVGCHELLRDAARSRGARLVASAAHVLEAVGRHRRRPRRPARAAGGPARRALRRRPSGCSTPARCASG